MSYSAYDWTDEIDAEAAAVDKMRAAIRAIADGASYTFKMGDGKGGYIIETLKKELRSRGYECDPDPLPKKDKRKPISHSMAKRVFERDAYRCRHCNGHIDLTVDHIVPRSKGGKNEFSNYQTLCRSCNSVKGNKL